MGDCDIGLIGLAVMGENLVLNLAGRGYSVAVFNRTVSKVDDFVAGRGKGKSITGCGSVDQLVGALKRPRKVMLMVKAGRPVDDLIEQLLPYLEEGDVVIDGGNSHFSDSERRTSHLEGQGLLYVGTGVSGGEEGALNGPSIMPGGSAEAWPLVKPMLQAIAAIAPDGSPCCEWVGKGGAGHFVKMVHNGIEYGDMQMICEAYALMDRVLGLSTREMGEVFGRWNDAELNSYLVEITRDIMGVDDPETGEPLLDMILDTAGQKGTGKWTIQAALDLGVPAQTAAEAVFARTLSGLKEERVAAAARLGDSGSRVADDRSGFVANIRQALYASKICSYAQGFQLMRAASEEYGWDLNFGDIALMWRAGCIIRARFLDVIKEAFDSQPDLANLLLAPYFVGAVEENQYGWRRVVARAVSMGVPVPAFSSALAYYDGYRSSRLPANLLQAQRDYFGAHTYERVDKPRGEFFHTHWLAELKRP